MDINQPFEQTVRQENTRARSNVAHRTSAPRISAQDRTATSFLGLFSIGLGLSQLLAPRAVARAIGVNDDPGTAALMRTCGLRELACGVGILNEPRPGPWLWTRVAGDVMDLALLTGALASDATDHDRLAGATAAVLGVTALDLREAVRLSNVRRRHVLDDGRIEVRRAITVQRPVEELYAFWRDFRNLKHVLPDIREVELQGEHLSRWRVRGPGGKELEWTSRLTEDRPHELIAWHSIGDADLENEGRVEFRTSPDAQGTEIVVKMWYRPPMGTIGTAVATMLGQAPEQELWEALRYLKQVLETGEILLSEGTLHSDGFLQRPAQPPKEGTRPQRTNGNMSSSVFTSPDESRNQSSFRTQQEERQ